MIRLYYITVFTFVVLFLSVKTVLANSSYVLPYPQAMPGSIFYKIDILQEKILEYWYFGDFGKFKYHLRLSDKYLVEAKTLFDYKQYLLAYKALEKSDSYFVKIKPFLVAAKKEGKNTDANLQILKDASEKHIEELTKLKKILPQSFFWKEEGGFSKNLEIAKKIEASILIRQKAL